MTLTSVVEFVEQMLTLAALAGLAISTAAYVKTKINEKEAVRVAAVDECRKVSVHHLLHNDPNFLTVSQILNELRASSYETGMDVRKAELSEPKVRLLLMDMISAGVLIQRHGDQYGVAQDKFDIGAVAVEEQLRTHMAAKVAVGLISKYPNHFDDVTLLDETRSQSTTTFSDAEFWIAMADVQGRGVAHRNDGGKWEIGKV